MSYRSLLKMRCSILELVETQQDGMPVHSWQTTQVDVRCFADLLFFNGPDNDPLWTADAAKPENRSGKLFLAPNAIVEPGNRIKITRGPSGTFEVQGAVDEAWTPRGLHHLECYVVEINRALAGA